MSNHNGTNGSTHDAFAAHHLTWADPEQLELEAEQNRLRQELADAKVRLQAARDRLVERDDALHEALREELAAAQALMADREERHRRTLEEIREEARREADRILDEARNGSLDNTPTNGKQVDHGQ